MGPLRVVGRQPGLGLLPYLRQRAEDKGIEDFPAVGAVEALDVGVLIGLAGLNEAQLDVLFLAPIGERLARQFGAVTSA